MADDFKSKPFRKGERCIVWGNSTKTGKVVGRWNGCYMVELDKPYVIGQTYKTIISTIPVHPDNIGKVK